MTDIVKAIERVLERCGGTNHNGRTVMRMLLEELTAAAKIGDKISWSRPVGIHPLDNAEQTLSYFELQEKHNETKIGKPSDNCCLNFGCENPNVCNNEIGYSCGDPKASDPQNWKRRPNAVPKTPRRTSKAKPSARRYRRA